jgi:hypothetical protein
VLLIAHAGHWIVWILYAVPVLIVLGSIAVQVRRERHGHQAAGNGSKPDPPHG